tara:strand:- start:18626 stop:19498 length:873 start_codon:yes stop_codon:yes gene_type:complete
MLFDTTPPRYLPHMQQPDILSMGLQPQGGDQWIETDPLLPHFHQHKLQQRRLLGDHCFHALGGSEAAALELAETLQDYLLREQPQWYHKSETGLVFSPCNLALSPAVEEPLWDCSLWVADDLLLMQEIDGAYRLTAASLCSPSDWRLEDKIGRSQAAIHQRIPGFEQTLTPKVERFLSHLRSDHPAIRWNWSLQATNALCARPPRAEVVAAETPLFYRCERQCLKRLPRSGAVVFSIRVYLHALDTLHNIQGALPALFRAIEATPPALANYKGFNRLAPALRKYQPARDA